MQYNRNKQTITQEIIDLHNEEYRSLLEREPICCNKEMNAIYCTFPDNLGEFLTMMMQRVGMPGWRGDSKIWPSFDELPVI